jgi:hypothetical protein
VEQDRAEGGSLRKAEEGKTAEQAEDGGEFLGREVALGTAVCPTKNGKSGSGYSTVTDFARLRGLSTSQPRSTAM